MAFKEFDIPQQTEPVSFKLAGEMYMCRAQIAAGIMLRFGKLMAEQGETSEDSSGLKMVSAVMGFFRAALMPADYERFMQVIDDPDIAIPLGTLVDIAGWLGEVYAGDRPTGESLPAPSDKLSSGGDSTDGASVATPTYSRSPQTVPST